MSYFYEGTDARQIRSVTRQKVFDTLTTALTGMGLTVGENDLVLLKSGEAAAKRYKEGKAFLYFSMKPTKTTRCRVLGSDNAVHSGEKHEWTFVIMVSKGNIGGKVTAEETVAADDVLMDEVRAALSESYVAFRNTLHFYNMKAVFRDDSRTGSLLNPLELTFYNKTRLPEDTFITVS